MIEPDVLRMTFDKAKQLSPKLDAYITCELYRVDIENDYELTEMDLFSVSCKFLLTELELDYGIVIDLSDDDILSEWTYMQSVISILACVHQDTLIQYLQNTDFKETLQDALDCNDIPQEDVAQLFFGSCINGAIGDTLELERVTVLLDYVYSTVDFIKYLKDTLDAVFTVSMVSNDADSIKEYSAIASVISTLKEQVHAVLSKTLIPVDKSVFAKRLDTVFMDLLREPKLYKIAKVVLGLTQTTPEDRMEKFFTWSALSWYIADDANMNHIKNSDEIAIIRATKNVLKKHGLLLT